MNKEHTLKHIIISFLLVFGFYPNTLDAKTIYLNVGKANVKKSLIAITPLNYYGSFKSKSKAIKVGQEIYKVIKNDLEVSNYFSFIDPAAFLEDSKATGLKPKTLEKNGFDFNKWKAIGTDFLVRTGFRINKNQIELDAYVYYVPQGKTIFGRTYKTDLNGLRSLSHKLCNDIVFEITRKKGIFNTKFVFTANRNGRFKEIYIMDWDGNPSSIKRVTHSKNLAISPSWSPDGKKLAFTNFAYHPKAKTRNADLFLYTLKTGKLHLLSYRKGTNSGATFHPNGRDLFFTFAKNGVSNIYKLNLQTEKLSNVTKRHKTWSLNLEPHISPDGKNIVFSSTRSGKPMVHVMTTDGNNVRRRTNAGWYNSSPRFSPDGKKIAFAGQDRTAQKGGHFDIFIMNIDGTNMERVTSARKTNKKMANNEEPSFSPDSKKLVFTSNRTGKSQIYIIDIDGSNERRITFDNYNYEKPKWSPYLE
jgi:TolB protein